MSHLRDIHRLRQNRNAQPRKTAQGQRLDRAGLLRLNLEKVKEQYSRVVEPPLREGQTRNYRRRPSNNAISSRQKYQRPQQLSPLLSIYNYSSKLSDRQFASNFQSSRGQSQLGSRQILSDRPGRSPSPALPPTQMVSKEHFCLRYVVGKGGFGKVWKVQMKKNNKIYAMKEMQKCKVINKKSVSSVMNERVLLARLSHPFIVNMTYAFQDRENLYLVMDYLNGGDLRYHIGRRRKFREHQARFFISCILLALQYIHERGIIHRDIKPQNLVMDSSGYLRVTDFGISHQQPEDNSSDTSGTPGYMAPQVICRKNHSFTADFFAVGVICYQIMIGKRPYLGKNRKQIREHILSKQVSVSLEQLPQGWSIQGADFVNKLLMRNPLNRLGCNGTREVKEHPWLKSIDWNKLLRKELKAPYTPISIEDNYDDYQGQISEDTIVQNPEQNALLLRDKTVQSLFQGYQFEKDHTNKKTKSTSYRTTASAYNSDLESSTRIGFDRRNHN